MKKFNRYTLYARYIPGLITLLPITLIYFFVTRRYTEFRMGDYLRSTEFVWGLSGTFVLSYFISMIIRELGYFLEQRYFNSKQGLPTTYFMLYNNTKFPTQVKNHYGQKIRNDFQLVRLTAAQELTDSNEAIRILNMATKYISTRYQQHEQIRDANISYGFSRNLSGGLFISLPTSLIGIVIGWKLTESSLIFWSGIASLVFLGIACFHKSWIRINAEKYAEKIFSLYLGVRGSEIYDY